MKCPDCGAEICGPGGMHTCREKAELPLPSTKSKLVVAVTESGFWGKGVDLEAAMAECRKAGARGSVYCVVYLYLGEPEQLKKVCVDSYGEINYPFPVESFRIGRVKIATK
jgi:hypothetical protein